MSGGIRRFACTQCGQCCNRSPEVELSEAAGLADRFVFRLMFRLYTMPVNGFSSSNEGAQLFYQRKRLLAAHSARKYSKTVWHDGARVEREHFLMISALAMDTRPGSCVALQSDRCSIYERRPLTCRTVPFHYSRADGYAERDLDRFVSTPGYRCDTGDTAAVVLENGRIVDAHALTARAQAQSVAGADRAWKEAIVRRMRRGCEFGSALPSLAEVEAHAGAGALTTSFRIAWDIAAEHGIISSQDAHALVRLQLETVARELSAGNSTPADRQTLLEMAAEYRHAQGV